MRHAAKFVTFCQFNVVLDICISPLLCKKRTTHKIPILQQKQEGSSVLHTTNAVTVRYPPPVLVTLEDAVVILLRIIEDH